MLNRNLFPGLLVLAMALPAVAADVSGIWSGTLTDRNRDPQDLSFRFTQKGDTVSGKMYGDNESIVLGAPKLTGSQLTFTVTTELNGQISTFLYIGITSGDRMELQRVRQEANQAPSAKPAPPQTLVLKRLT